MATDDLHLDAPPKTRDFIKKKFGISSNPTIRQVYDLANTKPKEFGPHAQAVFKAICKTGQRALIPLKVQKRFGLN